MTPELYEKVAPVLTVHSRRRVPNDLTAPALVSAALRRQRLDGQGGEAAGEEAAEAEDGEEDVELDDELDDEAPQRGLRSRQGLYAIQAEAETAGGARFVRQAVLRLTGNPNLPFQILAWTQGRRSPPEAEPEER